MAQLKLKHLSWVLLPLNFLLQVAHAQTYSVVRDEKSGKAYWFQNHSAPQNDAPQLGSRQLSPITSSAKDKALKNSNDFLDLIKVDLGLKSIAGELRAVNFSEEPGGLKIVRHDQIYNNVKVYGAGLVTRLDADAKVQSTNGNILNGINTTTTPKISQLRAMEIAKTTARENFGPKISRTEYRRRAAYYCSKWYQKLRKGARVICVATNLRKFDAAERFEAPSAELFVFNPDFQFDPSSSGGSLVWRVGVKNNALAYGEVFVNAVSGEPMKISSIGENATERWVYDCSNPKNDFLCYSRLGPASSPPYLVYDPYTFGRREGAPVRGANPIPPPNPSAGSLDVDLLYDLLGKDSETSVKSIYRFFFDKFSRNGGNGLGGLGDGVCPTYPAANCPGIIGNGGTGENSGIPVNVSKVFVNLNGVDTTGYCTNGNSVFAHYPAEEPAIKFCRGSVSAETLGHEYAHTIPWFMTYAGDGIFNPVVQGSGQSGALNESFADIMGTSFQYYMSDESGEVDWSYGNNTNVPVVRVLSDPSSAQYFDPSPHPYPDKVSAQGYYCGTLDNSGVHVNSTVPSHAAFLASEGGSFNGCTIHGIGLQKVIRIWYRALTTRFAFTTTFVQAYTALNDTCAEVHNNTSIYPDFIFTTYDCINFKKALQAVELDQNIACNGQPPQTPACAFPQIFPGDFNEDLVVNLADYNVLRASWGKTDEGMPADANDDGTVGSEDYNIWFANYTAPPDAPPMPTIYGDYDFDGDVDGGDFLLWQRQFGSTGSGLGADGNVDGNVDAADYTIWRDNYGNQM